MRSTRLTGVVTYSCMPSGNSMTTTEPLRGARTSRPPTALAPRPSLRNTTSTKINLASSPRASTAPEPPRALLGAHVHSFDPPLVPLSGCPIGPPRGTPLAPLEPTERPTGGLAPEADPGPRSPPTASSRNQLGKRTGQRGPAGGAALAWR